MKIVVFGGSGLIGKKLVSNLQHLGHDVLAASPSLGVNSVTGEGLEKAIQGAQIVVDVTNSPSFEDEEVMNFFDTSTKNLLAAESKANVCHHVALSIVNTELMQEGGYFRAKMRQESLIRESQIPYTIVRATQFFEFAGSIAYTATENNTVRLPSSPIQPIAAVDVADSMVDVILASPVNGIVDIAGPDRMALDEFVRRFLMASQDPRNVVTDSEAGYFGLKEPKLTPTSEYRVAPTRYADWLDKASTVD
jgi:uncharacterized protein YbjT (DUF2867 family)